MTFSTGHLEPFSRCSPAFSFFCLTPLNYIVAIYLIVVRIVGLGLLR